MGMQNRVADPAPSTSLEEKRETTEVVLPSVDIEQGNIEMRSPANVVLEGAKAATISLDIVPPNYGTPAGSNGKRVEKPLAGGTIGNSQLSVDADVQQGFFSCACKPCSPGVAAVPAEVPELVASGIALSDVAVLVPRDGGSVEESNRVMSL